MGKSTYNPTKAREYYLANREKILAARSEYRKKNADKVNAYHSEWRKNNPEKERAMRARRREAEKSYSKIWRSRNRFVCNFYSHESYLKLREVLMSNAEKYSKFREANRKRYESRRMAKGKSYRPMRQLRKPDWCVMGQSLVWKDSPFIFNNRLDVKSINDFNRQLNKERFGVA